MKPLEPIEISERRLKAAAPAEESAELHPPASEEPMDFSSWAARPAPRRPASINKDGFDLDALKIFLILAGLTAGMALAVRSLL